MVENHDIAAPVPPVQGEALAHAQSFSMLMGGLAGAAAGALGGAIWAKAGSASIPIRSGVLAAVGAVTGMFMSARTFHMPTTIQAPQTTDFLADVETTPAAAQPHVARLQAERAVEADTTQAL